jgi:hypothetical protein
MARDLAKVGWLTNQDYAQRRCDASAAARPSQPRTTARTAAGSTAQPLLRRTGRSATLRRIRLDSGSTGQIGEQFLEQIVGAGVRIDEACAAQRDRAGRTVIDDRQDAAAQRIAVGR